MSGATAFEVRFTEDARQDAQALDGSIRKQLRKALEKKLAVNPSQYGSPLVPPLGGYWSHHFAAHRVIYRVYDEQKVVLICAIGARKAGHKTDVYRRFEALVNAGRTAEQIRRALKDLEGSS